MNYANRAITFRFYAPSLRGIRVWTRLPRLLVSVKSIQWLATWIFFYRCTWSSAEYLQLKVNLKRVRMGHIRLMIIFCVFWFHYVHPNQSGLDLGWIEAVLYQRIRADLDHFAASAFEEAARPILLNWHKPDDWLSCPNELGVGGIGMPKVMSLR